MIDLLELARTVAEIASETRDEETGRALMVLVDKLLTEAGLPASPPSSFARPPRN